MRKIKLVLDFELSNKELESLVVLYQTIFSFNALNLYLSLYEYSKLDGEISPKRLAQILKVGEDDLTLLRQELEQVNLIKTYKDERYTIVINNPLGPKEFIQHPIYGRLYAIIAGQELYKEMILRYVTPSDLIEGKDISKSFDPNRLAVWDENLEKDFAKADEDKTYKHNLKHEMISGFDVDLFFESIPSIVYPEEFRTSQLKTLIAEVGSMFSVDFETMKRFMINSSNFETKDFDTRKFVYLLEKEYGQMKVDKDNPYSVDPISFIRHKQGYEYVGSSDQNLLNSLSRNFEFSNEVVNFLVEYVLDNNDNNLNRAYVEKIASTWKRNGVTTLEDALKQIQPKSKPSQTYKTVNEMPSYSSEDTISEEDAIELRDSIKKMITEDD